MGGLAQEQVALARRRGRLGLRCLPFQREFLSMMEERSVGVGELVGTKAVARGFTRRALSLAQAERDTDWLLALGVLRREVDGQGLTDRFRLAPLGRQLLQEWQTAYWSPPSLGERLRHIWWRWLKR
ncbi:hypothetical protein GlitD10_2072 [Gloeomargarita lithophora Alchichica-D10]|uniref:Uncharacterized protein n=2 Tax=Gloeomargarita TaxID=1188227 RepID=A0A1J0AER0_9CYAN|nr:hypothetical protein GlitD10_2072 [Gloeomargarita lithophora Alchichica-D10]